MKRFFTRGGLPAAVSIILLAFGATGATAQSAPSATAGPAIAVPAAASTIIPASYSLPASTATLRSATVTTTTGPTAAAPATVSTVPAVAPITAPMSLSALVSAYTVEAPLSDELSCLATAVYFEAKGEPLEGQLAVAEVVQNRARSGRYPTSLCAVVKQKAQFSFVRAGGIFPRINPGCPYWKKAQAIARIAVSKLATTALSGDVLWYHADYVAPSWGRRLSRVEKIGAHIFYRS